MEVIILLANQGSNFGFDSALVSFFVLVRNCVTVCIPQGIFVD